MWDSSIFSKMSAQFSNSSASDISELIPLGFCLLELEFWGSSFFSWRVSLFSSSELSELALSDSETSLLMWMVFVASLVFVSILESESESWVVAMFLIFPFVSALNFLATCLLLWGT